MTKPFRALCAIAIICFFSSATDCSAGEPLTADNIPPVWSYTSDFRQEIPDGESDLWWRQFSDPLLDSLIVMGIEQNFDLKLALRRQEIARSTMNSSRSGWFPTIGLSAGWNASKSSGATNRGATHFIPSDSYFNAGLSATWEIDLFGKITAGVKESKARYNASRAEYAATMVSITAQIASTYFSLRGQQRLLQVARAHCERQLEIVKIAQARFEAMLASKLDVAEAWQTYYSTAASIPMLENAINSSITALGILIGKFPSEAAKILAEPKALPGCKPNIDMGIPADLLRRRPDIIEAEMQVATAAAQIGVAKKDFLPTLTIEGNISTSARNLDNLFSHNSYSWAVSPTLSWTLFDGFNRKYKVVSAREQMEAAIDSYNLAVMNAIGETENALSKYDASLQHIKIVEKLCVENEEALQLSIKRYKDSLSPMTDVVNAQLNALAGESELVQARTSALTSLVALYEALGGGLSEY